LSSGATRNTAQGGFLEVEGIEQLQVVDAAVAFEMEQGVDEAGQQAFVALLAEDQLEDEVVAQGIDLSVGGRLHGGMDLLSTMQSPGTPHRGKNIPGPRFPFELGDTGSKSFSGRSAVRRSCGPPSFLFPSEGAWLFGNLQGWMPDGLAACWYDGVIQEIQCIVILLYLVHPQTPIQSDFCVSRSNYPKTSIHSRFTAIFQ